MAARGRLIGTAWLDPDPVNGVGSGLPKEGPGGGRVGLGARMEGLGLSCEATNTGNLANCCGCDGPQLVPLARSNRRPEVLFSRK